MLFKELRLVHRSILLFFISLVRVKVVFPQVLQAVYRLRRYTRRLKEYKLNPTPSLLRKILDSQQYLLNIWPNLSESNLLTDIDYLLSGHNNFLLNSSMFVKRKPWKELN